jgi:lipopolysaccharide/colanic/teichoic acid biosynthesis glycosyltransferase
MGAGDRMRRIVDIAGALVLLVFSLPLLAAIALAIKCETPGPLLERQPRIGRGGRRFELLSFRTTRYDPTRCRTRLPGERTRVGTVLHYTRTDILPQLFNVIQGDLALYSTDGYPPAFLG